MKQKYNRKIILIISCCFFVISTTTFANSISVPYCKANQLKIYELAEDTPGMAQTNTLYGVINISNTQCKLNNSAPYIWITPKNGHHIPAILNQHVKASGRDYVIIEPLTQKDTIAAEKLVWFSLHASDGEGPRVLPKFDKITVRLSGLGKNETFTVNYNGYPYILSISNVGKDIYTWDVIRSDICSYDDASFPGLHADYNQATDQIHYHKKPGKIYFTKVAACG